jgi:VIT1/CCC1 family predicted Fe2+/Mn2+ transporter
MKKSTRKGFSFGLTSGVITTLGLMIGLNYSTHSRLVLIGGILTIAIADTLSDALGIHLSEESDSKNNHHQVWDATFSTAIYKFVVTLTFLIPVLLFSLQTAIFTSIFWGFFLLSFLSVQMARSQKRKALPIVSSHLTIAVVVILLTYLLGTIISNLFG